MDIIKQSADHSWEAMMVAFFCVCVVGLLVWLVRSWTQESHKREERMAARIDNLEEFTRETLLEALRDNSKALNELTTTLHTRSCLLSNPDQSNLIHAIASKVAAEVKRP